MKDRLLFETQTLKNGITVYGKPWDVPFAIVRFFVPVGTRNNTGLVIPGSAHFLEHLVCRRSQSFPGKDQFRKFVSSFGCEFGAGTSETFTEYHLSIPSTVFSELFPKFIDHIFNPLITEEYIAEESGVIVNERKRKGIWFPGESKLGMHVRTGWQNNNPYTLRQIFGEDDDFSNMTPEKFYSLHCAYKDPRAHLFIGGSYDTQLVVKTLEQVTTKFNDLPVLWKKASWQKREYHEEKCVESDRHMYYLGGVVDSHDSFVFQGITLLGSFLTNNVNGTLYEWLRRDLGWLYNINFSASVSIAPNIGVWQLSLPLNDTGQVSHVRSKLHQKIYSAISDQEQIDLHVKEKLTKRIFAYQRISDVLNDQIFSLHYFGKTSNEEESCELLRQAAHSSFLKRIYNTYWHPDVSGEFLALPINS
jgi:predicted Zn-dependent peptidase